MTLRALGAEDVARRALPFGVLLPGAVWIGVSADGLFAGVLAWGVALLAVGATGRTGAPTSRALAGGVLLGCCLYLSYGLVLAGLFAAGRAGCSPGAGGPAVLGRRRGRPRWSLAFTAAGFWWFTGFARVRVIYAASIAADRPVRLLRLGQPGRAAVRRSGPAVVAGLRRAAAASAGAAGGRRGAAGVAALAAVLLADVSGMSKAEVERIWLPFAVWLVVPVRAAAAAAPLAGRAGRARAGRQPPAAHRVLVRAGRFAQRVGGERGDAVGEAAPRRGSRAARAARAGSATTCRTSPGAGPADHDRRRPAASPRPARRPARGWCAAPRSRRSPAPRSRPAGRRPGPARWPRRRR